MSRTCKFGEVGKRFCDDRQSIVLTEKQSKYEGLNKLPASFCCHQVDGKILVDEEKCDFLFYSADLGKIFFIELKGKDRGKAASQLLATVKKLRSKFPSSWSISCRSVLTRVAAPKIIPSSEAELRRFLRACGGDYNYCSSPMTETITLGK